MDTFLLFRNFNRMETMFYVVSSNYIFREIFNSLNKTKISYKRPPIVRMVTCEIFCIETLQSERKMKIDAVVGSHFFVNQRQND
jgi:hypothetical protein